MLSLMDILKWDPASNQGEVDERVFQRMTSTNVNERVGLPAMNWNTMTYKIGRLPDVPLDGLSFASYHKGLREEFLMRDASYRGNVNGTSGLIYDENGELQPHFESMPVSEYVDFLFISVLHRKALPVEKADLQTLYDAGGHTINDGVDVRVGRHDEIARITFDYIARLPELYYFKAVN